MASMRRPPDQNYSNPNRSSRRTSGPETWILSQIRRLQDMISVTAGTRQSAACQLGHFRSMKDRRESPQTSPSSPTRETGKSLQQSPWQAAEATFAGTIHRQLIGRRRYGVQSWSGFNTTVTRSGGGTRPAGRARRRYQQA